MLLHLLAHALIKVSELSYNSSSFYRSWFFFEKFQKSLFSNISIALSAFNTKLLSYSLPKRMQLHLICIVSSTLSTSCLKSTNAKFNTLDSSMLILCLVVESHLF